MATPETLFEVGATYLVKKDDTLLRDTFAKGQQLLYWRHGYSRYDGMHGWFFFDEQQNTRAWDLPEGDDYQAAARSTFQLLAPPASLLMTCKMGDLAGTCAALEGPVPSAGTCHLAFEMACRARSAECISRLLAIPGMKPAQACVFLHHAASEGFTAGVRVLLDGGANVNDADGSGQTALLHAACGGYLDTVKLLLSRGADASLSTSSGTSIVEMARAWKRSAVVAYLEQYRQSGNP